MMAASRWGHSCSEDERQTTRRSFCENDSAEWGDLADPSAVLYSADEEPFAWPGPKTVRLRRTSHGFGFTLRHFIVYPPESAVHGSFPEEDHGRRGRQRNRLEPMDTIFVKQVKEGGPAHGAGLCTGDRLVKVNGLSIIGKTYSEVIALIQESDAVLELCVMPKDEDILQLAYSQDAYIRSQSAYSGNACHIPNPPPICYPRVDCKPPGMAQATDSASPAGQVGRGPAVPPDLGYRKEITVPPSPPPPQSYPKSQTAVCMRNDSVRTVLVPPETAHMGRMAPAHRIDYMDPVFVRGRPGSVAQYPVPRKIDVYPAGAGMAPYGALPAHYPANHQNIDWRTYQTYREYIDNKGIHSHASRTIQERLDSLRSAGQNTFSTNQHIPRGGWGPQEIRRRSTSHDRSYHGPPPHFQIPPRSASQDRMSGAERVAQSRNWPPRSVSQDALTHKARARSTDYVDPAELVRPIDRRGGYSRLEQGTRPSRQAMPRQAMLYRPSAAYGNSMRGAPNPVLYPKGPESLQTRSSPMLSDRSSHLGKSSSVDPSLADQRAVVKSHHKGYTKQQSQSRVRPETLLPPEHGREGVAVGHRSCSASQLRPQRPGILKPPPPDPQNQVNGRSPTEGGVVMREKPPSGKNPSPLRHPSYILAVNDDGPDSSVACWLPNDTRREMHMRRIGEQRQTSCSSNLDESLDSIPFIDEPASPSVDREATSIPASAVISVAPATSAVPPSPTSSPCHVIRRQLSHDQESLRNALLDCDSATKTERSKSYDEGLDNYREEGRGRSYSKHVPGLRGLRKALDGHKSDDSGSRRDSSSEIFTDSSKEGWLHFRQLSTDKNKRASAGMKSWKQMYAVLRGHSLTLFKDKKDGVSHASSQSDEDPQSISIKACLIDISYSDTKRKNVLRLTTSDCEFLFQAEGRDDMLSWIKVVQENSNLDEENSAVTSQDLISKKIKEYNTIMSVPTSRSEPSPKSSRQSLSIKHPFRGGKSHSPHSPKAGEERRAHKDDSSPPRDRAPWRKGITGIMRKPFEKKPPAGVTFGVRLDDCPPAVCNRFVPLIVEVCCKVVEERGLEYTGIYRVPGNNAAISSMQEELNSKGMADIDVQEDKWRDLNVISSLLKSFFRKLPEPLFTNEKYGDFIEASRTEESVQRLKELKRLIHELPDHHYETLKFLSGHLKLVAEYCEKNKMEPRNLAIVFGPTLVRTSEDNMTNMVNHMPDQCKIVENLIQQCDWFFTDDGDEDPITLVEQESTVQSQPVPNIDHLLLNIGRTTASPGEVSDSACSDSSKSKQGLWGSGKDQCSKEMLRSSFFVNRKRKKAKDKVHPSSSDDDLDAVFSKKELPDEQQQPPWSPDSQTEEDGETDETSEKEKRGNSSEEQLGKAHGKEWRASSLMSPPSPSPKRTSPTLHAASPYTSPSHSPSLTCRTPVAHQSSLSDPPSNYDDTVSDLGTMNSTSSQASVPRMRHGRTLALGPEVGPSTLGAEVCSITSDYSTTSSMTFLTGAELSTLSPEVRSVAESRGGDDADDERSELISEGRAMETDSESDLSVYVGGKEARPIEESRQESIRPLPSHRLIECDTLSRKKAAARQKTDSESSLDGARSDKETNRLSVALGSANVRSTGSLSSSSRSESEKAEPAWRLKITDRLKFRLRTSVDDMFGVGTQRSRSPEGRSKKKNIRRRHTMGGQRDFAELSVLGDWQQPCGVGESAVDRLKPKCSSQDFSIRDWIARERHRTSNPEFSVSLDLSDNQGALCQAAHSSSEPLSPCPAELWNGDAPQSKNLSLSATPHPHKLSGAQVVHSRFYQYL